LYIEKSACEERKKQIVSDLKDLRAKKAASSKRFGKKGGRRCQPCFFFVSLRAGSQAHLVGFVCRIVLGVSVDLELAFLLDEDLFFILEEGKDARRKSTEDSVKNLRG
jgi:hypothetical protein